MIFLRVVISKNYFQNVITIIIYSIKSKRCSVNYTFCFRLYLSNKNLN